MMRVILIGFMLSAILGVGRAVAMSKHGVPALQLDERVSFEMHDQIFWRLSFGPNKTVTHGVIYYEHPKLQEPKMRRISLSMSSVTVREALNALVKADGSYSLVSVGDVVNFVPKKRNKKFMDPVKILNQVIPVYEVEGVNISDAIQELKIQAAAQGVKGLPAPQKDWRSIAQDSAWERDGVFSLNLKNKTVRECLNAIVAADSPAKWLAIPFSDYVFIGAVPSHYHTKHLRKPPEK